MFWVLFWGAIAFGILLMVVASLGNRPLLTPEEEAWEAGRPARRQHARRQARLDRHVNWQREYARLVADRKRIWGF